MKTFFKKHLSIFLVLAVVLGMTAVTAFADTSRAADVPTEAFEGYYPDVKSTAWYYEAVSYVTYYEVMTGYQSGKFGPADALQRQDFVVTLSRVANAELSAYQHSTAGMSDVSASGYYAPAVAWAVDNGIITGYQNGKFGVGDSITREQVCTILYRYYDSPTVADAAAALAAFPDAARVSDFAVNAIAWAVENGVISGSNGMLVPTQGASRAQIATILMRMELTATTTPTTKATTKATTTPTTKATQAAKTATPAEVQAYAMWYLQSKGCITKVISDPYEGGFNPPLTWGVGDPFDDNLKWRIRNYIDNEISYYDDIYLTAYACEPWYDQSGVTHPDAGWLCIVYGYWE